MSDQFEYEDDDVNEPLDLTELSEMSLNGIYLQSIESLQIEDLDYYFGDIE